MNRLALGGGAIGALLAVALGAFAAHGLRSRLDPALLEIFRTGVDYQMYHSLALIGLAALPARPAQAAGLRIAALCFLAGIVLFSGSLYLLALTGVRGLGMVTPVGGVLFLAGWAGVVRVAFQRGG